jgi:hypothetical protein
VDSPRPSKEVSVYEVTFSSSVIGCWGAKAVWIIYSEARLAYIYKPGQRPEVRDARLCLDDAELLPGFSAPLAAVLGSVR